MKIVELIPFLCAGGAERFIVDLSNELSKTNETHLITILDDTKDTEIRNFYNSEINSKVIYKNLKLPNGFKISSQVKVLSELKKINPDIIHVHLIPTLKYSALALAILTLNYKVYFTVHNDLHNQYDKGIFKLFCNTVGKLGRFKLCCLSQKNYQDFKDYYPSVPIKHIDNGRAPLLPTKLFEATQKELQGYKHDESSLLLLHVARCHPVKNQKLLIEAVNDLITEGKNIDLVIIGIGYESSEGRQLQAIANNRIHFIGPKKNIADYMLNADIFCLSSDFEGMPITLLEAGLAGVPCVSTPVCGAVDLIHDGLNGILSKSHELEDYKTALSTAIDNYDAIKKHAMEYKENNPYTIAACASKYLQYFNE